MLASLTSSSSPFWNSFKPKQKEADDQSKQNHNSNQQPQPPQQQLPSQPELFPRPSQPLFAKYTTAKRMAHDDEDEIFPSAMELTVLGDLIEQLKTMIVEEIDKLPSDPLSHNNNNNNSNASTNNPSNPAPNSSQINRSPSMRNRPRPLSGLGLAGLQQSPQSPKRHHSRSQSRSSILSSMDSSAAASLNGILNAHRTTALYPYCEVVGEHTLKLAENATQWGWALEAFRALAEIYKVLEINLLDKCPCAYILTTMSLLACNMCRPLEARSDDDKSAVAGQSNGATSGSGGSSDSAGTVTGKESPNNVSAQNNRIGSSGNYNSSRLLSKKDVEHINEELCTHILGYFTTLVTTTSALTSSTSLNLILGQAVRYLLAHVRLTPKFTKTFFENLRVSQRLFWYPRNHSLRQWRLYWLRVVMDRVLVYQEYLKQASSSSNNSHHSNNSCNNNSSTGPSHESFAASLNVNLEGLSVSTNNTANDHERSDSISSSSSSGLSSPALSSTTTTSTTATSLLSPAAPTNATANSSARVAAHLIPRNVHDIPSTNNLKKIQGVCLDELYLGVPEETDEMLKQQAEAIFGIQTQNKTEYVYPMLLESAEAYLCAVDQTPKDLLQTQRSTLSLTSTPSMPTAPSGPVVAAAMTGTSLAGVSVTAQGLGLQFQQQHSKLGLASHYRFGAGSGNGAGVSPTPTRPVSVVSVNSMSPPASIAE